VAILLNNPGITPATSGFTYQILWLSRFNINAGNPNMPVSINAAIDKAKIDSVDSSGTPTSYSLMKGGTVRINIPDFFSTATLHQLFIMSGLLTMLQQQAGL
jgi:hypothetical protein